MPFDPLRIKNFPEAPGVYLMKGDLGDILYIGKAKDLRSRVRQYFQGSDERSQIPYLLEHVQEIDVILTRSEKEALLLEQTLIQKHKPHYNILLKDDKSQLRIVLSQHEYPKLEMYRSKNDSQIDSVPVLFQSTGFATPSLARDMFDLVSKTYHLRQCSDAEFSRRKRPCLLYHIKKCTAPCVGLISHEAYMQDVQKAIKLLKGDVQKLLDETCREMHVKSALLEFERALVLRRQKEILEAFIQRCKVETVPGISNCDVIGFWVEGRACGFSILVYRDGKLRDSSSWVLGDIWSAAEEAVTEFIMQLYGPNYRFTRPQEIMVPIHIDERIDIEEYLQGRFAAKVQIKFPLVGPKRALVKIANENAKARLQLSIDSEEQRRQLLYDLQEVLKLRVPPRRVDCFDTSHLSGSDGVASCVSYLDGMPYKRRYRTISIQSAKVGDDYGMLKEALSRRYRDIESEDLPDLILIDGGKGQLSAACEGLKDTKAIECDLISISKEAGRHDKGLRREQLFKSPSGESFRLDPMNPVLMFLQSVRDEAHRFALAFQKKKRLKRSLYSQLDSIEGIGPVRKRLLIKEFGSVEAIGRAGIEEVRLRTNIPQTALENLFALFAK